MSFLCPSWRLLFLFNLKMAPKMDRTHNGTKNQTKHVQKPVHFLTNGFSNFEAMCQVHFGVQKSMGEKARNPKSMVFCWENHFFAKVTGEFHRNADTNLVQLLVQFQVHFVNHFGPQNRFQIWPQKINCSFLFFGSLF